jgi:hypothetical protein
MSAVAAARIEAASVLQGRIETLRRELSTLACLSADAAFVVVCEHVPLAFTLGAGGDVQAVTTASSPFNATRFSQADAVRAAVLVQNGNHVPGLAVHVQIAQAAALREAQHALQLVTDVGLPTHAQ